MQVPSFTAERIRDGLKLLDRSGGESHNLEVTQATALVNESSHIHLTTLAHVLLTRRTREIKDAAQSITVERR